MSDMIRVNSEPQVFSKTMDIEIFPGTILKIGENFFSMLKSVKDDDGSESAIFISMKASPTGNSSETSSIFSRFYFDSEPLRHENIFTTEQLLKKISEMRFPSNSSSSSSRVFSQELSDQEVTTSSTQSGIRRFSLFTPREENPLFLSPKKDSFICPILSVALHSEETDPDFVRIFTSYNGYKLGVTKVMKVMNTGIIVTSNLAKSEDKRDWIYLPKRLVEGFITLSSLDFVPDEEKFFSKFWSFKAIRPYDQIKVQGFDLFSTVKGVWRKNEDFVDAYKSIIQFSGVAEGTCFSYCVTEIKRVPRESFPEKLGSELSDVVSYGDYDIESTCETGAILTYRARDSDSFQGEICLEYEVLRNYDIIFPEKNGKYHVPEEYTTVSRPPQRPPVSTHSSSLMMYS